MYPEIYVVSKHWMSETVGKRRVWFSTTCSNGPVTTQELTRAAQIKQERTLVGKES